MSKFILNKKNYVMVISAGLLVSAFISHYWFHNEIFAKYALIIASLIGVLPILIQAYQALKVKVISIELLVTLAVFGAFIIRNYEESAVVTFLFLFGAYLELRTLNKTRSAIKELTRMAPDTALKQMKEGEFLEVEIDEVDVGDTLLVKTGAKVPVDGKVLSGSGYINESSITGESRLVNKNVGSIIYAGTILENGTLIILTDKVGEDTMFGKIIELVEEAQEAKSETERFIDRFSKYYTPVVLILAIIVGIILKDIEIAVTILVLGCPGALVIGVPVSSVAGIGNGAKNGILLKGSEVINDFARVDTFVFDKTGTLTEGNPKVADIKFYSEDNDEVLKYLASVEKESDHPLAKAITEYININDLYKVDKTEVIKGKGIVAFINKKKVIIGNLSLIENEGIKITDSLKDDVKESEEKGNSVVLTVIDGKISILMGIRDQIRSGVKENLVKLRKLGVKNLIVLSGDNQGTVDLVAKELGLTKAIGNMLPKDKSDYVSDLQSKGHVVAFVGDGINDSPSLALADLGIAMGNGTDVAIETSDVVLMNSDFNKLPHALGLSKRISINMKQNIFIAVGVVLFLLSSLIFGEWMNMAIGMLVHEGSILVVILNGMRLLKYKLKK